MQTTRVAALNNRVPFDDPSRFPGSSAPRQPSFFLALYLALLSRGLVTVLLAAGLLTLLLFVTFDLDRPTRGLITIPDAPLVHLRASMELPPAAKAPSP